MDRKEKALCHVNKSGCGIEIGPSFNPIAPKREGYDVHVIDHVDRTQLLAKYRDHCVNLQQIEEVDFVWHGENFSELIGKTKYYDWIIASHVIEHTPDLVGFLNDCDDLLKDGGVVSLIIPDKRYCFDYHRPLTGLSQVIDSHYQNHRIHTPGTVAEYFLNVVSKDNLIAWNSTTIGENRLLHGVEDSSRAIEAVVNNETYFDVHAWCFVPHSFRLMIHDLFILNLISFQEVDFFDTEGSEFHVTLGRNGQGIDKPRLDMLDAINTELQSESGASTRESREPKSMWRRIWQAR